MLKSSSTLLEPKTCISANAETFEIILGKLLINAWESYREDTRLPIANFTSC